MKDWNGFIELIKKVASIMERNSGQAILQFSPGQWKIANPFGIVKGEAEWEGGTLAVAAMDFVTVASPLVARGDIAVSKKDSKVVIRCGKFSGSLPAITNPFEDEPESGIEFQPLGEELIESADIVSTYTSTDLSSPELSSIHVTGEAAEATNRQVWVSVKAPGPGDFLLPLKHLALILALGPKGAEIGLSSDAIHCKCERGAFVGATVVGQFPDTPDLGEGIAVEIDRESLTTAVGTISQIVGGKMEALISFSFPRKGMLVLSAEYKGGTIRERVQCKGDTEEINDFRALLPFLSFASDYAPESDKDITILCYPGKCVFWESGDYSIMSGVTYAAEV